MGNQSADSNVKNKILWLSIVQGWAILLVVVGHVNAYTYAPSGPEEYGFAHMVKTFCYSFHMPLFMFVSGGLLFYTRIDRKWSTGRLYADKLKRLMIPYAVFSVFALVLKSLLSSYAKRSAELSPSALAGAIVDPANGPLAEMWFVATLMWLMLMYPVYKAALKWQWTELTLLGMTLLPLLFGTDLHVRGWFNLAGVLRYAFYFVGGMLFFKHRLYARFEGRIGWAVGFTACYVAEMALGPLPSVAVASTGILMSVAWGVWIADKAPGIFSSFRDHSFQIFLVGIFPQMFVELFLWKRLHGEWLQLPYYFVSCLLAIAAAVILSRLAARLKPSWLRWCFGLK